MLRRGVDFFVGTCGRVLDHIERGNIDFSALKSVVLDEADQMLKQGFKEEVDKVSTFEIAHLKLNANLDLCLYRSSLPAEVNAVRTCRFVSSQPPFQAGLDRLQLRI